MRKHFGYLMLAIGLTCTLAAGQQRPQPPARTAPSPIPGLAKAPAPIAAPYPGDVEGFVYWDANALAHQPRGDCSGLAITVSFGSSSGGPLEAYRPMATVSNNFKYAGQVRTLVDGGKLGLYEVCAYAYDHVPVGSDLQVQLTITQPTAFSPSATPQVAILGPIKIVNGRCNMLQHAGPPSVADLTAHWASCQNRAYDVNFVLLPSTHRLSSGGSSLLSGHGGVQVERNPGPVGNPLLKQPGPAGTQSLKNPGPTGRSSAPGMASPSPNAPLNPQPPGVKGASPVRTALKPIKLTPPKALRKLTNPRLLQENASIIVVLQQQRQAAGQEASAMKLGIRSTTSAGATTVSAQKVAPSTLLHANAGVSQIGSESTQGATGPSGFQIVNKQYAEPVSIACAKDPTPRILSAPSVFTPEAKYNLFTISGCGFGPSAGANTAYIFGGNGFRENLVIDFWSDRGITAHLDPALAGVLDRNDITLVIAPAGRQPLEKSGFKFYAARGMPAPDGSDQEVRLAYNSIRNSDVAIFNVNNFIAGFDQLASNATKNFPSFSFQGTPVAGWVFRYSYAHFDRIAALRSADCYINDVAFNGDPCNQFASIGYSEQWQLKSDSWDFSELAPGFQISSYQLYVSTLDPASLCSSWDDMGKPGAYLDGDWDFNLTAQNQIAVTWPVYRCFNSEFGTRDNMGIQSAYGLAVSVMGPRCVDPWTGQKDQSCMNKIRQTLN